MLSLYNSILLILVVFFLFIIIFNILKQYRISNITEGLAVQNPMPLEMPLSLYSINIGGPFDNFVGAPIYFDGEYVDKLLTNNDVGILEIERRIVDNQSDQNVGIGGKSSDFSTLCNKLDYPLGINNATQLMIDHPGDPKYALNKLREKAVFCKSNKKGKKGNEDAEKTHGKKIEKQSDTMKDQAKGNQDKIKKQSDGIQGASDTAKTGANLSENGTGPGGLPNANV